MNIFYGIFVMMNIFTFTFTKRANLFIIGVLGYTLVTISGCAQGSRISPAENRVPPDQTVINDFPNLYYSSIPDLNRESWTLKLTGLVREPATLDWNRFSSMDTVTLVSDFHCVTGWSRLDNHWTGVRLRDIIRMASPDDSARYITFIAADAYRTYLPIEVCLGDENLLAFRWEGEDLSTETGGPVRVVIPKKYGYKSAKWLIEMRFTAHPEEGTWESQGYSHTADPWKNDRVQTEGDTALPHRFK